MHKAATLLGVGALALTALSIPAWGQPSGTFQGPSSVETAPSASSGDDADDPAIWVDATDPSQSRVITNEKKSRRLAVYDLQGQLVQSVSGGTVYFGNVDVRGDWVVAAHNGIVAYRVDGGRLVSALEGSGNAQTSGEGLCLWQDQTGLYAINVSKGTFRVRVHPLTDADHDGLLQVQKPVKDWVNQSEGESCVVDDATDTLYMSVEDVGIYTVNLASPSSAPARTLLAPVSANLTADIEGLAITGSHLIASAQNGVGTSSQANWYAVFDKATGAHQGDFRVTAGPSSDDCDQTDGIAIYAGDLGPAFPNGMFVCQDGYNQAPGTSGNQDFKFVRLDAISLVYSAPPPDPTPTVPTETTPTDTTEPTTTEPTETTDTTEPTTTEPTATTDTTEPTDTTAPTETTATTDTTAPTETAPTTDTTAPTETVPTGCG
jgi:3-phytase